MKILVIQNFDNTDLGQIAPALDEAGAELDTVMAHSGERFPDRPGEHDGLIVLGGGQNALDDAAYPYLPALATLMRDFALSDRAVLGVCLGSQLLARGLGGRNIIGETPEFGWHDIALTREGRADPLLGALPEHFPIFEWHDDTFTLPAGAVRLAGSSGARNQAFRAGRAGYGLQFHFEADRKLVRRWNEVFADYLAERQPDWPRRFEGEAARHGPAADAAGRAIARAWTALV